ncbi:MAG: hypothetical protein ABFS28_02650 [Bacteroidota bacterium]
MSRLKETIGKRVLKKKLKDFERQVHVHNFETAKSAVILFDANEAASFPLIKDFRKFVESKGIQCKSYGCVQLKEIPQEMLFQKSFSFITKGDLNWYLKPTGEVADEFYSRNPDILFDLSMKDTLELQFLVKLSKAQFKISSFTDQENDYDLMIKLTDQHDVGYLCEQIKHYVSMLNPSN